MMARGFTILLLIVSVSTNAQDVEQFVTWAEAATAMEDHYGASVYYGEALKLEPGTMALQWSYAEACRNSDQCPEAARYYGRVADKDHRRSLPDARMHEAEMLVCAERIKEAKRAWEKVLEDEKNGYSTTALRATNALRGIAMMDSLKANKVIVDVEQLPAPVNSCNSDIAPRLAPDGSLYFTTSRLQYNNDYVVSDTTNDLLNIVAIERNENGWGELKELPKAVNSAGQNGNAAWTKAGHFIFSRCLIGAPCQIMMSKVLDGEMQPALPLEGANRKGSNTQPMVAIYMGSEMLFFTSDRKGGSGERDIWMGVLDGENVQNVRPIGAPVNSPGDETCPFFDEVEKKLYFSSNFHPGMGGFDNFSSYALKEGFSAPVNLGYPLNTHVNELYPSFYPKTNEGFFSRSHSGMEDCCAVQCCPDIFKFAFPRKDTLPVVDTSSLAIISGPTRVVEGNLQALLPIRLYFHNDEPDPRSWNTTTSLDYEQTYQQYRNLIPKYEEQQGMDPDRLARMQSFFNDEAEQNFRKLNRYMDLLTLVLERGDTVELTIRGFASPLAKSDYNANLSLRRINSLVNYLNRYRNGALRPYLRGTATGGKLLINTSPFGESTAASHVSDALSDQQNSVYSREAAMERRIEIEAIDLIGDHLDAPSQDTLFLIEDMGRIIEGQPKEVTFLVENTQDAPLQFLHSKAACGCTNAQLPDGILMPGHRAPLKVLFNGRAPKGTISRDILITTDGKPKFIKLTLIGEMVEP